MTFTQAYAAHPRCVPSRYAIMTGRFPARAGVPGGKEELDAGRVTIASAMKDAGYATYYIGKWHLGGPGGGLPNERGFDVNVAGGEAGATASYFFPYNEKAGGAAKRGEDAAAIQGLDDGKPGEHLTARLTVEAEKLLEAHEKKTGGKPFFMVLSHYAVHTPIQDTPEMTAKYEKRLDEIGRPTGEGYKPVDGQTKQFQDNAAYAAMIERMDASLGEMVKTLDKLGMADNTLVIVTSDHGGLSNRGAASNRDLATSNLPLRAGKGHLYEGGIRVPLIVRWPAHVAPGTKTDAVTVNTDHFATFLDLAGASARPHDAIDGASYRAAMEGKPMSQRPLYWYSPRPRPNNTGDTASGAIRVGSHKLIHWYADDSVSLYDVVNDASESHDMAKSQPDLARKLDAQLTEWLQSVNAVKARAAQGNK